MQCHRSKELQWFGVEFEENYIYHNFDSSDNKFENKKYLIKFS